MADMIKLWLSVVTSVVLLLCVAAEPDSGATGGCNDLCSQMALHLDFDTCMVECVVAVAGGTQTDIAAGELPPSAATTGSINTPTKRRFVRIGRQVAPLRFAERAANPFVRIGRTFVRIGRPQRRAVSSFMRIGKRWPYGKTDDVDGDRLSAKRVASFIRIGRSTGGAKRTSAFVRIGKRSAADDFRTGELARLVDRLSVFDGDSGLASDGADKRGSPFVRIGQDPLEKRPQFVRIGRR